MLTSPSHFALRARFALALGGALAATLAAPRAHAQEPLPPPPPPPASARAPNGEYVAPLQQQTQPSYVPQSVALSGPATRPYNPDAPIPPGYHPEQRVRRGLIIGGAIPLGILYTFSILGAAAMEDSGESGEFLYVPVLGPFLQMSKTENSVGNTVLALDGIGQAAGAAMLLVGLTVPKTVLVRNDLGEIRLAPMNLGQRGSGLGLVGTF